MASVGGARKLINTPLANTIVYNYTCMQLCLYSIPEEGCDPVEDRDRRFVDRTAELTALRDIAARGRPALLLIYGRRRVGKTYLLDHAWRDRRVFYYLAANATAAFNRRELLRDLTDWAGRDIDARDYPTWRAVFRLLVELATDAPLIVVLDEFQYLMNQKEDDIASQLVAVWDREVRDRPITLALSGSAVAMMERLAAGSQPLYGRFAHVTQLAPFDYYDAAAMLPGRTARDAAYLYGALGGLPRNLAAARPDESVAEALTRVMIRPSGEVHVQIANLITQEQGIRSPAEYQGVLAAVARGATQINAIAQETGLDHPAVRRILEALDALGLVRRERNFAAAANAPWWYRIADHAVGFWYAFVDTNRSRLAWEGASDTVWAERVAPALDTYMGKVFETICAEAYRRFHADWGLAAAHDWARWEGRDRNRRSIEIDLVARLDDGGILTGEIKWSSRPVDVDIHRDLTRDLEDLGNSGQGWARSALGGQRLYVSAAGFTDPFRQLAARDRAIHLITLTELYPGSDT